jgi:hypothetical protein
MLSKKAFSADPLKSTDAAVPEKLTPAAVQVQKAVVQAPFTGKLRLASGVPVPSRPLQTVTEPGSNGAE